MFYKYTQNNSGGSYDIDDAVAYAVIIEASSSTEADDIAKKIGIYFDGCSTGADCPCCGDRWCRASDYDATKELEVGKWDVKRGKLYLYTNKGETKTVITEPTEVDNVNAPVSLPKPVTQVIPEYKPEKKIDDLATTLTNVQLEAAKIYSAFIDSVALPGIFKKESVELAVNTIKKNHYERLEQNEVEERRITEEFIKYLEEVTKL
jgi:hypothetical protein